MPYKVYKFADDRRNTTCGFVIPNGGWYHVLEMTFENYSQLQAIGNVPGYSVDFVDGPTGMFDPDGNQVDPMSLEIDKITKDVLSYKKITAKQASAELGIDIEVDVKADHEQKEREDLIKQCKHKGVNIDRRWSTSRIKATLAKSQQLRQDSLALG